MRKKIQGKIVSDKMDKTVVVLVTRLQKDPKYGKYFHTSKKFKAHDESNQYHTDDEVIIEAIRPLSRDKRWRVVKLVKKGSQVVNTVDAEPVEVKPIVTDPVVDVVDNNSNN